MSRVETPSVWTGSFVRDRLGVTLATDDSRSIVPVEALVGLALRRNPRRAHLLVSTVLAKHVPTDPAIVVVAGRLLGALVAEALGEPPAGQAPDDPAVGPADSAPSVDELGRRLVALLGGGPDRAATDDLRWLLDDRKVEHPEVVTIGYAETATGLGSLVADEIGSAYVHSTRHSAPGVPAFAEFEEEHSHATSHRLLPVSNDFLTAGGTVVLVDDELSTGRTVLNTIDALQHLVPQRRWIVAALVDLRDETDRGRFADTARSLGVEIDVVALGAGSVRLPDGLAVAADELLVAMTPADAPDPFPSTPPTAGRVSFLPLGATVPAIPSDRYGRPPTAAAVPAERIAAELAAVLPDDGSSILVLGTEEFIALPLAVTDAVAARFPGRVVQFSTTTRSPIHPLDRDDYAIASSIRFASHDDTVDGPGTRYAYNLSRGGGSFDHVALFPEPGTDPGRLTQPGGITDALAGVCPDLTVVLLAAVHPSAGSGVGLPEPLAGPAFGSYDAADVRWLLQDLGDAALEAPTADREAAIQSGRANYAESLPVEYVPSPEYQELYRDALARSARRVAEAVGIVTELALSARDGAPVLVSLARAGTPIGVLMRRWAWQRHGLDLPHYTMSIVRGVGIDRVALRWLAAHHDSSRILFVDGWTGKGAISRELSAAIAAHNAGEGTAFRDDLAVLADPGHCVTLFGTRDDFLIPSACLNSTVSGLVSRTVYSESLIGPDEFHGAKFYREMSSDDVSRDFVRTVAVRFDEVRAAVTDGVATVLASDRTPTWLGWRTVERIAAEYGIDDVNLVKPGVGETTRVLLRRVPWKVLVHPDALDEVAHVLLLARQRGVEIVAVPDLPYSCVGLIHPQGGRVVGEGPSAGAL